MALVLFHHPFHHILPRHRCHRQDSGKQGPSNPGRHHILPRQVKVFNGRPGAEK
jgi:hypothetical protein